MVSDKPDMDSEQAGRGERAIETGDPGASFYPRFTFGQFTANPYWDGMWSDLVVRYDSDSDWLARYRITHHDGLGTIH